MNPDPLENMLQQIGEMMKLIKNHQGKDLTGEAPEDILIKTRNLAEQVYIFQKVTEAYNKEIDLSQTTLSNTLREPASSGLSKEERNTLKKATDLLAEAKKMRDQFQADFAQSELPSHMRKKEKKGKGSQAKKLKKIGGKKGWNPV